MKVPATYYQEASLLTMCAQHELASNKPRRRCVRFEVDSIEVNEVLSRHDYTQDEAAATWYTKRDYKMFKRQSLETLKLNRAGLLPAGGNAEHTMRGLECRTREGMAAKKEAKARALVAALNEQERQRQESSSMDPLALAAVLKKETAALQHDANIRGLLDQLETQEGMSHLANAVASRGKTVLSSSPSQINLQGILESSARTVISGPAA